MNIIISEDHKVRLTQYSNQATYNLEDIAFYIAKALPQSELSVVLKVGVNAYKFTLQQTNETHNFYNIYKVIFTVNTSLRARIYDIEVRINDIKIPVGVLSLNKIYFRKPQRLLMKTFATEESLLYELSDVQLPIDIDIKNRIIQITADNNENPLISGDNRSQIIRFRLPVFVDDGIDISSENKNIYIDYKINDNSPIISKQIDKTTYSQEEIEEVQYLIIPWIIENDVTAKAGTIEFALSITGDNGYVWQTLPAQLHIQKGLGRDFNIPINSPSIDPTYNEVLDFIQNIDYISDINTEENTLTQVTRETGKETIIKTVSMAELLDNNEGNIILSGGGAIK